MTDREGQYETVHRMVAEFGGTTLAGEATRMAAPAPRPSPLPSMPIAIHAPGADTASLERVVREVRQLKADLVPTIRNEVTRRPKNMW